MNFTSKLIVTVLLILSLLYIKDKFFTNANNDFFHSGQESETFLNKQKDLIPPEKQSDTKSTNTKTLITLYFTSTQNGSLKKITRELPENSIKLEFAIKELLKGPDFKDKQNGYSSEIPKGTKLLKIKDEGGLIIIDLSDEFQYGGGTESQYTRVDQLIKTVLALNLSKPVYLYINGHKAEVIGGEGIIINQPLSEASLNG